LNRLRFERGVRARHGRAMHETHDKPNGGLIAALFCAIIGMIVYAGFVY
jgi:hypothetical protein